jgi:hypothetical protein
VLVDEAAESAVFAQIVATYTWLNQPTATPGSSPTPTSTLTSTPTPFDTPTPTFTSTAGPSSTPGSGQDGTLAGQITASKPVTLKIYDSSNTLVGSTQTGSAGTFSLNAPAGVYTVVASADGFLSAQGAVTLTAGNATTMPVIVLIAGDIDGNNVIDQFDALTIGMSYNSASPSAADLNNDGIINVLDLEALAKNYRKTGPITWQ